MSLDHLDVKVKFIRGFADKTRLQILICIHDQEKTVSQIVREIEGNQSNVSQHLACLKGCGIVESRQVGKYMYYSIKGEEIKRLLRMFDVALGPVEEKVACCETVVNLTVPKEIAKVMGGSLNERRRYTK